MKEIHRKYSPGMILFAAMLLVYFGAVCLINFCAPPSYYDSDMYTDMRYAMEAWTHKSVFPEGWVFGNQLYFLSTPVLAALFYGLTGNPELSMGLSSTVMTIAVLWSFFWMLKPVIRSVEARLAGLVLFMGMVLYFGDAWHDPSGWQLLFTMCSYYACYAMTVFLVFGCWLRSEQLGTRRYTLLLAAACLFSFGTGIQSLRQTAVMTLPLIGAEVLKMLFRKIRKLPFDKKSFAVTALVSAVNLLGLVTARSLDLEQVEIIGEMKLVPVSEWLLNIRQGILLALSLVINHDVVSFGILAVLGLVSVAAVVWLLISAVQKQQSAGILMLAVLVLSLLAILAVDVLTTMLVRSIYYFMLFPVLAFLAVWLYDASGKWVRRGLTVFILAVFLLSCGRNLGSVCRDVRNRESEAAYAVSDYLQENGYTTIYAAWNEGADVVIASDWNLQAGFWEDQANPFFFYKYLCNLDIFRADSEECVYLFHSLESAALAVEKAGAEGIEMTQIRHFPQWDIYLYTAPVNLMEVFW